MGWLWRYLTRASSRERSRDILRSKQPPVLGLSAETAGAVASGEAVIDTDDEQAEILKALLGQDDPPTREVAPGD